MNNQKQTQNGGENSTNIQAQSLTVNQGISFTDAKEIALDVYKENFLRLSTESSALALSRAEEITEQVLKKIIKSDPNLLERLIDPGLQMCLYKVQKEYAKTGDKDLEGLLVDIIIERAKIKERNIQQIVLDESIKVASKLTVEQMDALSLNFTVLRTQNNNVIDHSSFYNHIINDVIPFTKSLLLESTCFEHLEYVGCGSINYLGGTPDFLDIYLQKYCGLFMKGFLVEEVDESLINIPQFDAIIIASLLDNTKKQINAINEKGLRTICANNSITGDNIERIVALYNSNKMKKDEVMKLVLNNVQDFSLIQEYWEKSKIASFNLTTVGMAIAQANYRRRTGIMLNMKIWIK